MNRDRLSEAVAYFKEHGMWRTDEDLDMVCECTESVIASYGELPERRNTTEEAVINIRHEGFNEALDLCAVAHAKVKAERDELKNKHRECLHLISQDEHRILEVMKENHSLKARVKELESQLSERELLDEDEVLFEIMSEIEIDDDGNLTDPRPVARAICARFSRPKQVRVTREEIKQALYRIKDRWVLCWDGHRAEDPFDCACCLNFSLYNDNNQQCKCKCHEREIQIADAILALLNEKGGG